MKRRDVQFLLLVTGVSTIFVLNHTEGSILSGPRGTALFLAVALILIGAIDIPLHRRRSRKPSARELRDTGPPRAWVGLAGRFVLAAAILVVPIAVIEPVAGLVALGACGAAVLAVLVWHSRSSQERGVPDSERWQQSHVRVLDLPVPVDSALAIAEDELRSAMGARVVERPASWEVVAQTKTGWANSQQVSVTGLSDGATGSEIRIEAQPNGGVLDGGRSWTIVDTLELVLRERSAAEAASARQRESV